MPKLMLEKSARNRRGADPALNAVNDWKRTNNATDMRATLMLAKPM